MKKTKTLYWIFTGLFSAFMSFTAIPNILMVKDSVDFLNHLGYPNYFIPFIGVAKVLGSMALLIPGIPRIKEWAYAGLSFELIGAVYSLLAVDAFQTSMLFMALPLSFLVLSYVYHHKLLKEA